MQEVFVSRRERTAPQYQTTRQRVHRFKPDSGAGAIHAEQKYSKFLVDSTWIWGFTDSKAAPAKTMREHKNGAEAARHCEPRLIPCFVQIPRPSSEVVRTSRNPGMVLYNNSPVEDAESDAGERIAFVGTSAVDSSFAALGALTKYLDSFDCLPARRLEKDMAESCQTSGSLQGR